jgi:hypothetical protein
MKAQKPEQCEDKLSRPAARRRATEFSTFLVGQSCCSALNSWAAQQRRPTEDTPAARRSRECLIDCGLQEPGHGVLPFRGITTDGGFVAEGGKFLETLWGGNGGENAARFLHARPGIGGAVQKENRAADGGGVLDRIVGKTVETRLDAALKHQQLSARK